MRGLELTDEARSQLRHLRVTDPELFSTVSDRIKAVREDPGSRNSGNTFLLEDGRTARLATFYDHLRGTELCLVWMIREVEDGPLMRVQWAAPFEDRLAALTAADADLRGAVLLLTRRATDSGRRTSLDDVISRFGFDRAELEAELDAESTPPS